ncbi:MAG: hypothetical protein ACFCVF_15540 [Kineosporiaceae bacterium]
MSEAGGTVVGVLLSTMAVPLLVVAAVLWAPGPPLQRLERRVRRRPVPGVDDGPVTAIGVAAVADRLAAAVEAGLPLPAAWAHATGPAGSMTIDSADPVDRQAAAGLEVALRLAGDHGLPAAEVARAVADAARDVRAADTARAAASAGPLAAARIVAGLPLAGPVLAALLGVDVAAILLGTTWGRACLAGGLTLVAVAAWWSHRLVVRARTESRVDS